MLTHRTPGGSPLLQLESRRVEPSPERCYEWNCSKRQVKLRIHVCQQPHIRFWRQRIIRSVLPWRNAFCTGLKSLQMMPCLTFKLTTNRSAEWFLSIRSLKEYLASAHPTRVIHLCCWKRIKLAVHVQRLLSLFLSVKWSLNLWSLSSTPTQRSDFGFAGAGNLIYVFGGLSASGPWIVLEKMHSEKNKLYIWSLEFFCSHSFEHHLEILRERLIFNCRKFAEWSILFQHNVVILGCIQWYKSEHWP